MAQTTSCRVRACTVCSMCACSRMAQQKTYNCQLCNNRYATHSPMDCPHGTRLCHGTKVSNLSNIPQVGFQSNAGRLGAGLYLTDAANARAISVYRGQGTGVCVIHCNVALGKVKDNGGANDHAGSWRAHYDSARGLHPS